MPDRWITFLRTEDPGLEEPGATRERLRERFPKNATRRMTQLGLLVGACLETVPPAPGDTLIYASGYGETRALEGYLDSFPTASPTLFQTSIHPSAVQQALIARQQPVSEYFPLAGGNLLTARALRVALLAEAPRTLLCGGEERGTWLLERRAASERAFGFALALSRSSEGAIGRVSLQADASVEADAEMPLAAFFDLLHARRAHAGAVAPGLRLRLEWS